MVVDGVFVRYICQSFSRHVVLLPFFSCRHVGDPSLKRHDPRELCARVRLALTGSGDQGGGLTVGNLVLSRR